MEIMVMKQRVCNLDQAKAEWLIHPPSRCCAEEPAAPPDLLQPSTNSHRLFFFSSLHPGLPQEAEPGALVFIGSKWAHCSITCSRELRFWPNRNRSYPASQHKVEAWLSSQATDYGLLSSCVCNSADFKKLDCFWTNVSKQHVLLMLCNSKITLNSNFRLTSRPLNPQFAWSSSWSFLWRSRRSASTEITP